MKLTDITKNNGFDINYQRGSVLITNKEAISLLNIMNGTKYVTIKIQNLIPNSNLSIEQQIIEQITEL